MQDASGQPASGTGCSTVLSGARTAAVSAMNLTPHRMTVSQSSDAAALLSSSESPTKSARACMSAGW